MATISEVALVPLCLKCNDTGTVNVFSGGGTKPRIPGTPQVYGMRMDRGMCMEEECLKRRVLEGLEGAENSEELGDAVRELAMEIEK